MIGRKRAGFALAGILSALLVAGVLIVATSSRVSASQRTLERILARRAVETWAESAVEETCASLEAAHADVGAGGAMDLGKTIAWPAHFDPVVARTEAASMGFEVGPVEVVSSEWLTQRTPAGDGTLRTCHVGILEFRVVIANELCGGAHRTQVRVRRYADAVQGGGGGCAGYGAAAGAGVALEIQSANLMFQAVDL